MKEQVPRARWIPLLTAVMAVAVGVASVVPDFKPLVALVAVVLAGLAVLQWRKAASGPPQ